MIDQLCLIHSSLTPSVTYSPSSHQQHTRRMGGSQLHSAPLGTCPRLDQPSPLQRMGQRLKKGNASRPDPLPLLDSLYLLSLGTALPQNWMDSCVGTRWGVCQADREAGTNGSGAREMLVREISLALLLIWFGLSPNPRGSNIPSPLQFVPSADSSQLQL